MPDRSAAFRMGVLSERFSRNLRDELRETRTLMNDLGKEIAKGFEEAATPAAGKLATSVAQQIVGSALAGIPGGGAVTGGLAGLAQAGPLGGAIGAVGGAGTDALSAARRIGAGGVDAYLNAPIGASEDRLAFERQAGQQRAALGLGLEAESLASGAEAMLGQGVFRGGVRALAASGGFTGQIGQVLQGLGIGTPTEGLSALGGGALPSEKLRDLATKQAGRSAPEQGAMGDVMKMFGGLAAMGGDVGGDSLKQFGQFFLDQRKREFEFQKNLQGVMDGLAGYNPTQNTR